MAREKTARKTRKPAGADKEALGTLSDAGAKGVSKAISSATGNSTEVPGPSDNPATNLIIHDILMRAGGRLLRQTVEKGVLANRYGGKNAKQIVENRTLAQALLGSLVARVATRSIPGAVIVGGGLVAKTLYDRGRKGRRSKRAGDTTLGKMAED